MIREKILITIDRDLIWEYFLYYKMIHPKARTFPLCTKISEKQYKSDGSPKLTKGGNHQSKSRKRKFSEINKDNLLYGVMSLNELLIIQNRMTMNDIKSNYGDLGLWIADRFDITNKMYSNSIIEYRIYGHTKTGRDLDNLSAGIKFLNDKMLVGSKGFVNDNYNHICPLVIGAEYDKKNPRTEIRITILDDSIKDIYEKMQIHIDIWK